MRVLLTGFEPFGKEEVNPSELAVRAFQQVVAGRLPDVEVRVAVLPVSFRRASSLLEEIIEELKPDVYVGVGLRSGVSHVAVERVAVNLKDARILDNDGEQPIDEPIVPGGPAAYFSTLPVKAIVRRLRESGVPAAISNSAGTFLCNFVMYLGLHLSATRGYPRRAGFIHVPLTPEQVAARRADLAGIPPSMSLNTVVKALEVAVRTSVELFDKPDERVPP